MALLHQASQMLPGGQETFGWSYIVIIAYGDVVLREFPIWSTIL